MYSVSPRSPTIQTLAPKAEIVPLPDVTWSREPYFRTPPLSLEHMCRFRRTYIDNTRAAWRWRADAAKFGDDDRRCAACLTEVCARAPNCRTFVVGEGGGAGVALNVRNSLGARRHRRRRTRGSQAVCLPSCCAVLPPPPSLSPSSSSPAHSSSVRTLDRLPPKTRQWGFSRVPSAFFSLELTICVCFRFEFILPRKQLVFFFLFHRQAAAVIVS